MKPEYMHHSGSTLKSMAPHVCSCWNRSGLAIHIKPSEPSSPDEHVHQAQDIRINTFHQTAPKVGGNGPGERFGILKEGRHSMRMWLRLSDTSPSLGLLFTPKWGQQSQNSDMAHLKLNHFFVM
jgi:hypothetical protein